MVILCKKKHILIPIRKFGSSHTMKHCVKCRSKICVETPSLSERLDRVMAKVLGISLLAAMVIISVGIVLLSY